MSRLELRTPNRTHIVMEELYKDLWQMCTMPYWSWTAELFYQGCTGWKCYDGDAGYYGGNGPFYYGISGLCHRI